MFRNFETMQSHNNVPCVTEIAVDCSVCFVQSFAILKLI
jgi:hypothetical protein